MRVSFPLERDLVRRRLLALLEINYRYFFFGSGILFCGFPGERSDGGTLALRARPELKALADDFGGLVIYPLLILPAASPPTPLEERKRAFRKKLARYLGRSPPRDDGMKFHLFLLCTPLIGPVAIRGKTKRTHGSSGGNSAQFGVCRYTSDDNDFIEVH